MVVGFREGKFPDECCHLPHVLKFLLLLQWVCIHLAFLCSLLVTIDQSSLNQKF